MPYTGNLHFSTAAEVGARPTRPIRPDEISGGGMKHLLLIDPLVVEADGERATIVDLRIAGRREHRLLVACLLTGSTLIRGYTATPHGAGPPEGPDGDIVVLPRSLGAAVDAVLVDLARRVFGIPPDRPAQAPRAQDSPEALSQNHEVGATAQPNPLDDRWISAADTAALLAVSLNTVRRYRKRGLLTSIYDADGRVLIRASDIVALVDEQDRRAATRL